MNKYIYILFGMLLLCSCSNKEIVNQVNSTNGLVDIYFLDVGQGDSTLIIDNDKSVLIDCGDYKAGDIVLKELNKLGIKHLDYLILSHQDLDHIGGCGNVLMNINIDKVYYNGDRKNTKVSNNVLNLAGNKTIIAKEKDRLILSSSTINIIQLLTHGDSNERSIVTLLSKGNESVLLTADCEQACEEGLLNKNIKVNVLKVAHHGSKYATSDKLLDHLSPTIAVISVGKENRYGHPGQETLTRLTDRNISIYRTDIDGMIDFKIDTNSIIT